MVILSWINYIWKIDFISSLLKQTNSIDKSFYFNKDLDLENKIKDNKDLKKLTEYFLKTNRNCKIIILQNISNIIGIKDFISFIYNKENIKIIIIWNNIKIPTIPELELKSKPLKNLENSITYWDLWKSSFLNDLSFKKEYINLIKKDIVNKEIFYIKSVKNQFLYNYTISFLSKNEFFYSNRELHREISKNETVTLKTLCDYIDYSIQAKIISKVYKYDIKNNKTITSKARYFFSDNWIRNCAYNFSLNNHILQENLIFVTLNYYNFNIYWWNNWVFDFSFYWEKENKKIYIHLSKQTEKNEIKKELNKLLKIADNFPKYLIIQNLDYFWVKRFNFKSVEILSFEDFIIKDFN